ncbi:MAG: DMT family transporter [Xanthobacteraceae bacterium]
MPLAGAVAINFSPPLFAALVSVVWLKERAGGAPAAVLVVGFLGVLIVTDPGADSLTLGARFALINAVIMAALRWPCAARPGPSPPIRWSWGNWRCWLSFIGSCSYSAGAGRRRLMRRSLFGTGFINALGQWFWTRALHLAPAAAVTPFYYLMLLWALLIGFVVWGDVPTVGLLVGSAIVVATGLFLFQREARMQRRLA